MSKAELTPTVITFEFEQFGENKRKMLVAKINGKTYSLNTLSEYVPDWGIDEGTREYEQNRIDQERVGFKTSVTLGINEIVFWTESRLPLESLAYGFTTKREQKETIGFFGDGFKKGTLAYRRASVEIKIVVDAEGTTQIVKFPDKASFLRARRFLDRGFLREGFDEPQIMSDRAGELFVNGVFVKKINSKFGVNLVLEKGEHLDSDRNIIDENALFRSLGEMLAESTENKKAIAAYMTGDDPIIGNATIYDFEMSTLDDDRARLWRKVWKETYGEEAVVGTKESVAAKAEYEGAKVVTLPMNKREALSEIIKTDEKYFFEHRKKKFVRVSTKDLKPHQQKLLTALRQFIDIFFGEEKKLSLIPVISTEDWNALGEEGGSKMWIKVERLDSPEKATKDVLHELTHTLEGVGDNVQEQVEAALRVATRVAVAYVKQEMGLDE